MQLLRQREKLARGRHVAQKRLLLRLVAVAAARIEDHALAHGGGHVRHDADDGIVPARKLLNARDVQSRDHTDEHRRALALLERRGDALEHVHDHLRLHAEEDVVRLARDDLVAAHNGPDALRERLRLCLRAVGEQHLHLAASGRRARQRAAHISCADKANLHHLPCPFYTHQEPKRSPVPCPASVFIISKGYINPRRLVKHRARQSPVQNNVYRTAFTAFRPFPCRISCLTAANRPPHSNRRTISHPPPAAFSALTGRKQVPASQTFTRKGYAASVKQQSC